jgi:hypothetical protein
MAMAISDDELVRDGYRALYKAATPSADFDRLVAECTKYIDAECNVHYTDFPLSVEELTARTWKRDIGYMDYTLDEETYRKIVEDKVKEHKLTGMRATAFRNTMYLGSGPAFCEETNKKP